MLGDLTIARDWGWAPEYVDAMWRMLQHDGPDDYVVATGQTFTLGEFVLEAFAHFGLDWRDHVINRRKTVPRLGNPLQRRQPGARRRGVGLVSAVRPCRRWCG